MKADPDYDKYMQEWSALYEGKNYDEGLAGYFLTKSHAWCEQAFGPSVFFPKVLEVGAGTGVHIGHVKHGFDEYIMSDLNAPMLDGAANKKSARLKGDVITMSQDAAALSFEDESFDRVIAVHVLEHILKPHLVLREWMRVLRPGGVLSIVLPCDPGLGWRLGRALGARQKFVEAGIDYDYWMAREHVNAINNLVSFIRYYFPDNCEESWKPLGIPSMDLNLFYIAHIRKP